MFESQVARREGSVVGDSTPSPGRRELAAASEPSVGPTLEAAARLGHHLGVFGLARPLSSPIQCGKRKKTSDSEAEAGEDEDESQTKKVKPNWHQDDPDLGGPPGPPPMPSPLLSRAFSMPMPPPSPQGFGRSLSFGSRMPSFGQSPLRPFQGFPPPSNPLAGGPFGGPPSNPFAGGPFGGPLPPPPASLFPQGVPIPGPPPPTATPSPQGSPIQPPVSPPQPPVSPPLAAQPAPKKAPPTPWIPPGSEPMSRPRRPTFRNRNVNKPADPTLVQPITTVVPKAVEPGPLLSGSELDERLAEVEYDETPKVPIAEPVDKLRQFAGESETVKGLGLNLTGGNQGGLYPEDPTQVTDLPESADYTASRPQQLLSQLGEVFLHHGNKAKVDPVEVQFGYGQKADGSVDLYSSTNNKKSQKWLLEALKTPVAHLKAAAKNTDDPNVARVAQKILFFKEQNAKRREQIKGLPNKDELEKQLDLAEKIHDSFFKDPVRVATNEYDRHAEQNIADVMHDKGYISGDIQGPKIRCEGCSSELGQNLQNASGARIVGRVYALQADPENHEETFADITRGRTKVATNRTERSRSHSPAVRPKPKPKPAGGASPLAGPAVAMAGPPPPPLAPKPSRRKPEKDDDTPMSVASPSAMPPGPPSASLFAPPPGPPPSGLFPNLGFPPPPPPSSVPFHNLVFPPPPPPGDGASQTPLSPPQASKQSSVFDSLFDSD